MAKRNLSNGAAIPMEPGERSCRVVIQQLTEGVGESRFPTESWATLTTTWMRKMDLSQDERFKASQMSAAIDTQWEMAYSSAMDPDLEDVPKKRRLVYKGRVYDIVSADVIGRREGIELTTVASSKRAAA